MCGSPDIPAPDPRVAEATLRQIALAEKQYSDYTAPGGDRDWQRGITNEALGVYRRSSDRADDAQQYQLGQAKRQDQRYWDVGVPFEDQLLHQVQDMDTEQYRQSQVNRSLADTQTQFDNARGQGIRSMTRRGSDPSSGAYGAMMADGGRAQALAMATAANKTRLAAQQVGLSNKMQMYGGMRGMAGLGATSAQLALGAGGQQNQNATSMAGAAYGSIGANNQTAAASHAGMSAGISGYNSYYGNQVAAAKVAADNDPWGQILGAASGAATTFMLSDRRAKTDIKKVGELDSGLNLYRYRYKHGGPFTVGVMADEVKKKAPEAYVKGGGGNGYDAVDYAKL